jgi:metal-responsive CopG/Arc/MetJ family transcriptional regulator
VEEIKIKRKAHPRGDNGYKNVSVRMREELLDKLDDLAERTNYSRNELINFLLVSAIEIVKIEE